MLIITTSLRAMTRNEDCQLLALPQEILDGITSYIQEGLDVLCLALSHPYFFRLLADRVRGAVIADEAPWAGMSFANSLFFALFSPPFLLFLKLIYPYDPTENVNGREGKKKKKKNFSTQHIFPALRCNF